MNKIIPIIILLFLSQCSNKNTETESGNKGNNKISVIRLDLPDSGEDTLKTSYFADTVLYIPLETTTESFIDNIKQLWMDDSIIIISAYKAGLLMFQHNGNFIRKIGKEGRGPGEYGLIQAFDVIDDTIYISSTGKRSFIRYTLNGKFCDEVQCNYPPLYFSSTVNKELASYERNEGKILIYNKLFSTPDTVIVEYGVTKGRYYYMFGDPLFMTYFQKTSKGLLFTSYLNDTVWEITGDRKEPAFILNMKDELLPYEKQIEFCKGNYAEWDKTVKAYQLAHILPFSNWTFVFQKNWADALYDAIYLKNNTTGEIKRFNTSWIYDDLVGNQNLQACFFICSSDFLVTDSRSFKKIKALQQKKENEKKPTHQWINQMKSIKEGDNPILAVIKLKKNIL